ncbi:MAG: DUF2141 domain-containing protein [Paracoccaceae bacterium]
MKNSGFPATLGMVAALCLPVPLAAGDLTVSVSNARSGGKLYIALFDSQQAFENRAQLAGVAVPPQDGKATAVFRKVENGTYGIAVFQDLNGNGKLDTNLLGLPREPYGFSRNPRIGMRAGFRHLRHSTERRSANHRNRPEPLENRAERSV